MSEILNLAVCDDTEADRNWISSMVKHILREDGIPHDVAEYSGAKAILDAITAGMRFHVLLLDVVMDDLTGIELARAIRRIGDESTIIFISGNREMALYGYEVSAARYLAKPVSEEKLQEALRHCYGLRQRESEILLPTDQGQRRTSLSEIECVEAFDRGARFVLRGETVETRLKFVEVLTILREPEFIQCHRSFVVNCACVKRIYPNAFEMNSGVMVPISKHRRSEVSRKFLDYLAD